MKSDARLNFVSRIYDVIDMANDIGLFMCSRVIVIDRLWTVSLARVVDYWEYIELRSLTILFVIDGLAEQHPLNGNASYFDNKP